MYGEIGAEGESKGRCLELACGLLHVMRNKVNKQREDVCVCVFGKKPIKPYKQNTHTETHLH